MRTIMLFLLFSIAHGDSVGLEKIFIINNTDSDIVLEPPKQRNTLAQFPSVINAHSLGEIIIRIEKDWLIDTPLDVEYQQTLNCSHTAMQVSLAKNKPSPDLLQPFTPGFTCRLEFKGDNPDMSLISTGKDSRHCNTFYLY